MKANIQTGSYDEMQKVYHKLYLPEIRLYVEYLRTARHLSTNVNFFNTWMLTSGEEFQNLIEMYFLAPVAGSIALKAHLCYVFVCMYHMEVYLLSTLTPKNFQVWIIYKILLIVMELDLPKQISTTWRLFEFTALSSFHKWPPTVQKLSSSHWEMPPRWHCYTNWLRVLR